MNKRNIQHEILSIMLGANGLKYSQARPENTENDLYNYHLQFLVDKNLVEKKGDLYYLTNLGKKYVEDNLPIARKEGVASLFKISVLMMALKEGNGELKVLLQTRKRHPFYGDTGILSGKVKKEEKVIDTAKRKLKDETGLDTDFKDIALLRRIRNFKGEFFSDSFWFLCKSVGDVKGVVEEDNIHGKNFWATLDEAIKYEEESVEKSDFVLNYFKELKKDKNYEIPFAYKEEFLELQKI